MPHSMSWETRRQDDRIATNADQTEFAAVRYGSCNLDAGTFDDRIAESLDDYEVYDPRGLPAWAAKDAALDNAVSDIGMEIRRRHEILNGTYPFAIDGNRLVYKRSPTLVYEFCLAVSQSSSLSEGDFARLPRAFERLVRDVLVHFCGPGTQGMRTGWPCDSHEPRPARFRDLVRRLHDATGEWFWSPDTDKPVDPEPRDVKDEGLDVVVWKAVPDKRPGKLFLLGQCACGNDYGTKFYDIDSSFAKLAKWIKPISYVPPIRVFSTPRHIPNIAYFKDVNREAGFTLDRTRIVLLAEQGAEHIRQQAKEPYAELISIVISGFQAD